MPYVVHNTMGGEGVFLARDGAVTPDVDGAKQFDSLDEAAHEAATMNLTAAGLWQVEEVPYSLEGAA